MVCPFQRDSIVAYFAKVSIFSSRVVSLFHVRSPLSRSVQLQHYKSFDYSFHSIRLVLFLIVVRVLICFLAISFYCLFFFNYIKLYCYCLAPAVWGALRILFSYSHSFVSIYICHISLIQFSISSYHLFFISHLCSYSIFYSLYRKYILRFLPNNSCLIYSSRASQSWNFF